MGGNHDLVGRTCRGDRPNRRNEGPIFASRGEIGRSWCPPRWNFGLHTSRIREWYLIPRANNSEYISDPSYGLCDGAHGDEGFVGFGVVQRPWKREHPLRGAWWNHNHNHIYRIRYIESDIESENVVSDIAGIPNFSCNCLSDSFAKGNVTVLPDVSDSMDSELPRKGAPTAKYEAMWLSSHFYWKSHK
jgi:hypothetical protein